MLCRILFVVVLRVVMLNVVMLSVVALFAGLRFKGMVMHLHENIRLGWKQLSAINAPANKTAILLSLQKKFSTACPNGKCYKTF